MPGGHRSDLGATLTGQASVPLGSRETELPQPEPQPLLQQHLQLQPLQLQSVVEPSPRGVPVTPHGESPSSSTPEAESKADSYDDDEFEDDFEDDFESEDDELEESS